MITPVEALIRLGDASLAYSKAKELYREVYSDFTHPEFLARHNALADATQELSNAEESVYKIARILAEASRRTDEDW